MRTTLLLLLAVLPWNVSAWEDTHSTTLPFGVIDTHVHLMTTTNGISYTWAKDPHSLDPPQQCPCRPPCACNMSVPEYTATSKDAAPVDAFVFCEVSAVPEDWLREAQWVQNMAKTEQGKHPRVGAIMAQPPPGFGIKPVSSYKEGLDALQALPLVRGVRAYLDYKSDAALKTLVEGMDELGRRGMVVDTFVPAITDPRGFEVMRRTPNTTYNIEHFGCGCNVETLAKNKTAFTQWVAALNRAAKLPNVGCLQLGGTMAAFKSKAAVQPQWIAPMLKAAIAAFGVDRLCFEANWFFSNWHSSPHWDEGYGTWAKDLVMLMKEGGMSEDDMRKVFRSNAMRIYDIDTGSAPSPPPPPPPNM